MAENVVIQNAQGDAVVYENVSGIELPTESGGTATFKHDAEIKQADWDQEDSTKQDYIKNKPELARVATAGTYASLDGKLFGDIPTILEETELTFEKFAEDIPTYVAEVDGYKEAFLGEMYRVIWDGTEYLCECKDGVLVEGGTSIDNLYFIGNKHIFWGAGFGEDTGEPFLIYVSVLDAGVKIEIEATATETHTVSITPVNSVKKLDKKYMPDGLATEEFVKAEIAKIEIPEGGGSSGGTSGGVSSWNDLTDKPFGGMRMTLFEGVFQATLTDTDGDGVNDAWNGQMMVEDTTDTTLEVGQTYTVTWDGVEYECVALAVEGLVGLGNGAALGGEDTGEPFCLARDHMGLMAGTPIWVAMLVNPPTDLTVSGAYTCKILGNGIKHLDNEYLDFMDKTVRSETEIVAEQTVDGFAYNNGPYTVLPNFAISLVVNEKYRVVWDGREYEYRAAFADGAIFVGSPMTMDPFTIACVENETRIYTASTEASHTIAIYHVIEAKDYIKPEYLPGPPEFDLTAIGLPALTMDGTSVTVECDTAELRAALDKGPVKLIFTANVGTEVTVSGVVNAMFMADTYQCGFVGSLTVPMLLSFEVGPTGIIGRVVSLAVSTT